MRSNNAIYQHTVGPQSSLSTFPQPSLDEETDVQRGTFHEGKEVIFYDSLIPFLSCSMASRQA